MEQQTKAKAIKEAVRKCPYKKECYKDILITDFVECGLTYEGAKSLMKSRKHFVNGLKGFIDFKVNLELSKRNKEVHNSSHAKKHGYPCDVYMKFTS